MIPEEEVDPMSTTPESDGTPGEDQQVPAASPDQAAPQQAPGTPATEPIAATEAHPVSPVTEPVSQHPQEAPTQRIAPATTQAFPQAGQPATQPLHAPLDGPVPTAPTASASPWGRPGEAHRTEQDRPQQPAPSASTPPAPRPADLFAVPSAPPATHAAPTAAQAGSPAPHAATPQGPHSPYPGPQGQRSGAPTPPSGYPAPQQQTSRPGARPTVSWGAPAPAPQAQESTPGQGQPQQGVFAGPYGATPEATDAERANGGPEYPAAFGAPAPADQQPPAEKKQRNPILIPIVATAVVTALLATGGSALVFHAMNRGGSSTGAANIATLGQNSAAGVPVSGSTEENPDWQAVASAVKDSVVAIQVVTSAGEAEGSGVIADADGNIITNNHVVSGAQDDQVQVTLTDGRIYTADVVGTDSTTDLAVIRLQDPPSDLSPAAMAEATPTVGDPVMAVGNPLGLANTVTTGIVSALDRPVSTTETGSSETVVTNAIQIDAAVNPGNSGGPLFNAQGEVIGITSSIATTSSASGSIGLGFAIPITLAQTVAGQLVQDGVAEHAFLGVGLNDGTATADGVTRAGAQVMSVSANSPASEAGLQTGDVIVAIDDKVVAGAESLTGYVRTHASGDEVTLTVVRDGKSLTVDVTLAVREEDGASSGSGSSGSGGSGGSGQGGSGQGDQNGQGDSGSGDGSDGSDGSGDGLENMTPDQLWEWFQQQQGGDQG